MKRYLSIAVLILASLDLLAQRRKQKNEFLPTFPVEVDADLREWGDQLVFHRSGFQLEFCHKQRCAVYLRGGAD